MKTGNDRGRKRKRVGEGREVKKIKEKRREEKEIVV